MRAATSSGSYEWFKMSGGPKLQKVCADVATIILNWWSEHFQTLFAANHTAQESAIQNILQQMVKSELDNCPILNKTVKAISQMKSGKVAGVVGIPPEVWKQGGSALRAKLHDFLIQCWEQGALPQDLHDSVILTLYKGKGDKMDCSNYQGITLLSISGKIRRYCWTDLCQPSRREYFQRASAASELTGAQTTWYSYSDSCRRNAESRTRDLTKAFNTVSRRSLWLIMKRLGCPPKVNMVRSDMAMMSQSPSQFIMLWKKVASSHQHCLLSSSVWCCKKAQPIWMMKMVFT